MRRPSSGRRETRRGAPFYKVKFVFDTQEPASRWALLFGETKTESPPGGQAMRTYCPLSRGSRTTWPMLPQATTLMANGLNDLRERDRHHSCMTGSGEQGPAVQLCPARLLSQVRLRGGSFMSPNVKAKSPKRGE